MCVCVCRGSSLTGNIHVDMRKPVSRSNAVAYEAISGIIGLCSLVTLSRQVILWFVNYFKAFLGGEKKSNSD